MLAQAQDYGNSQNDLLPPSLKIPISAPPSEGRNPFIGLTVAQVWDLAAHASSAKQAQRTWKRLDRLVDAVTTSHPTHAHFWVALAIIRCGDQRGKVTTLAKVERLIEWWRSANTWGTPLPQKPLPDRRKPRIIKPESHGKPRSAQGFVEKTLGIRMNKATAHVAEEWLALAAMPLPYYPEAPLMQSVVRHAWKLWHGEKNYAMHPSFWTFLGELPEIRYLPTVLHFGASILHPMELAEAQRMWWQFPSWGAGWAWLREEMTYWCALQANFPEAHRRPQLLPIAVYHWYCDSLVAPKNPQKAMLLKAANPVPQIPSGGSTRFATYRSVVIAQRSHQ